VALEVDFIDRLPVIKSAPQALHHVRKRLMRQAQEADQKRLKSIRDLLGKAQEDLSPERRLDLYGVLVDFPELRLAYSGSSPQTRVNRPTVNTSGSFVGLDPLPCRQPVFPQEELLQEMSLGASRLPRRAAPHSRSDPQQDVAQPWVAWTCR
jgi:hypothetical protein